MTHTPRTQWVAHESVDPLKAIAGAGSPMEGQRVRESRDIDGATSTPVICLFDVTGSMQRVPRELVSKLPTLLEQLAATESAARLVRTGAIGSRAGFSAYSSRGTQGGLQ